MNKFERDFLKDRAKAFFDIAQDLIRKQQFDLAAFNLEQSAQLYLKHYLFKKTEDFPRTHILERLLDDVMKIHNQPDLIGNFRRENILAITDLSEAYLTSRYLPTDFPKEKVLMMKKTVQGLRKLLLSDENKI